jgi:hypothetical protein
VPSIHLFTVIAFTVKGTKSSDLAESLVPACDMPKQKTSASSATRKKHARRHAAKGSVEGSDDDEKPPTSKHVQPQQKGQKKDKKSKKNEPRVKTYVAPTKPKGAADPVDLFGLGLTGDLQVCHMVYYGQNLTSPSFHAGLSSETQQER